jgi:hypothetical protein
VLLKQAQKKEAIIEPNAKNSAPGGTNYFGGLARRDSFAVINTTITFNT